jgi:non-ribosomal peptide synthetase component E (peptide arylation enzyme)
METPLTPLDFARRTRRLHGARTAVVDGDLRLSYEQFFDRCDRWPAALQGLGVGPKTATGKIQKFVLRQGAPNLARQ